MKYIPFLLLIISMFILIEDTQAQVRTRSRTENSRRSRTVDKKPTSGDQVKFTDHLWYGGSFAFGGALNGTALGIAPMVGYKIMNGPISVGPRIDFQWINFRAEVARNDVRRINLINVNYAGFVRAKVFRGFFLQGEYGIRSIQDAFFNPSNQTIVKERTNLPYYAIGAGYNFASAGPKMGGSEIGIMYDLSAENVANSLQNINPIGYRFGFTYNF
jgi:hypothetical protein